VNADTFVLSLPLAAGQQGLALAAFVGGLSAATGMVIVEAIAVSTMVCNDLVMPLLLRCAASRSARRPDRRAAGHPPRGHRRRAAAGLPLLPPRRRGLRAGQHRAHQLCRGGAVRAGHARRHVLEGRHARGALAGLLAGFALWAYTLMLPSIAKSGWWVTDFVAQGPFGLALLRPEQLLGLPGWTT
jgi:Na+/proline symporter